MRVAIRDDKKEEIASKAKSQGSNILLFVVSTDKCFKKGGLFF
jgi:hypothetical protein